MTSSGAATSEQDFSPSSMRSPQSLAASFAALSGVSSWVMPTRTIKPGSQIAPTTRWPTVTLAWLTRCTTARTGHLPRDGTQGLLDSTDPGRFTGGAYVRRWAGACGGRRGTGYPGPDKLCGLSLLQGWGDRMAGAGCHRGR